MMLLVYENFNYFSSKDRESFDDILSWIKDVREERDDDVIIVIVANKIDDDSNRFFILKVSNFVKGGKKGRRH